LGDALRFELRAECTFSGELGPAKADIEAAIARAKPLLLKGAPRGKEAEAANIDDWRIVGKKLELTIKSGRYVRAHDALFRLTKLLSEELGKKHKIGLRGLKASEYRVVLPVSGTLSEQARHELADLPSKISYKEEVALAKGIEPRTISITLILPELNEASLRSRAIDRLVAQAVDIITKVRAPVIAPKVVQQGPPVEHPFKEDPFEVAKRLGWIVEFPGRGQWIYSPQYAKLLMALEGLIVEEIALKLGFEEVLFPKLIPLEVIQKMPGYLDELPEGMYYVCPPPREPEAFADFKKQLKLTRRVPTDELEKCLKEPAYVLAPAQCEPFYHLLSRRKLRLEDMPVKFFDRSGWTYRWEGGAVEGLLRVQEFRRIEFVYAGKPDDVVEIRDAVKDKSIKIARDLGLEWRLLVATPFYMRTGGIEEDTSDSRNVATYDIEARLPYKDGWLEIGSYNVNRTKFNKTFRIKEVKDREIWTGCCGFGSSRWALGFLAQHGFDQKKWPQKIMERMKTG